MFDVALSARQRDQVKMKRKLPTVVIDTDLYYSNQAEDQKPEESGFKRFDASFSAKSKAIEIKDGDVVVDYKDVFIEGYLSTFGNMDRDQEIVLKGAYAETLPEFMSNPVMLKDHDYRIDCLAGSFIEAREDERGLYVRGKISNSPEMKHVRFLIVEGHLKALSIGGAYKTEPDGVTISKVILWEGSLVTIPANNQALFTSKSLTEGEEQKVKSFLSRNGIGVAE